ncbi:methionyl-tRNA formyltransferase, partial [candidate division WOR-3 bacterium]|nr:methionyl-tRNA formyltransferase [candidate division WOR-3 bacterium]
MRLAFFGTSGFALPALQALHATGHSVAVVVTAPARPRGRGLRLVPGPVEAEARRLGLNLRLPEDPHSADTLAALAGLDLDLGVLVAYGFILRERLLAVPRLGFVNVHPSLLPEYRGAAPIQRALFDGRARTGVTIIAMNRQVDAGDILCRQEAAVGPDETAGELSARLAALGAELLLPVLESLAAGTARPRPQVSQAATPAPRLAGSDRLLDWSRPAPELHNRVRGLSPEPGAVTVFRGRRLLVLRSRLLAGAAAAPAGSLLLDMPGLAVATGDGILELMQVAP